jgi:hypothetical protein
VRYRGNEAAIFILAAEIEHDALNLKAMHIQSGNTTLWRA